MKTVYYKNIYLTFPKAFPNRNVFRSHCMYCICGNIHLAKLIFGLKENYFSPSHNPITVLKVKTLCSVGLV